MEKRNVFDRKRTPCLSKQGSGFCDCDGCKKAMKKTAVEGAVLDLRDVISLARVHK